MTTAIGLVVVLLVEVLVATTWLDGASLLSRPGLSGQIGAMGSWVLRLLVGFSAAFLAFAGLEGKLGLNRLLAPAIPARWAPLLAHIASAGIFAALSAALYGNWTTSVPDVLALAWILSAVVTAATFLLAYAPFRFWAALLYDAHAAAWLAAAVAIVGVAAVRLSQSMWLSAARMTFSLVKVLLYPIIPTLTADPEKLLIRGHRFGVLISPECSGLEGIGLMLVFSLAWLWLYRREFRFPRAYLLIPIGVSVLYLLNAVRISALLLIGDAGFREIAAGGFHSQAGWISFNAVALGMTLLVPRLSWFVLQSRRSAPQVSSHENPTATYLLPFLAILASGMLARAASGKFDWFYGLRFFAAAGALWIYRHRLTRLDRRTGWTGIAAGFATFGVWLAFDQWQGIPAAAMPAPLAAADPLPRIAWVVFRALAAITTVPIAEELAFRGFLLRRINGEHFESVPFQNTSWLALTGSSIAFGLLHGDRWIAGIAAGVIFGLAARSSNRIGDAVTAHALTNALLAAYVLTTGQWQYW